MPCGSGCFRSELTEEPVQQEQEDTGPERGGVGDIWVHTQLSGGGQWEFTMNILSNDRGAHGAGRKGIFMEEMSFELDLE